MAKQLLLIRHCSTGPAFQDRYIGSTDLPADPAGLAEADRLVPLVQAAVLDPVLFLVSPLRRCQKTATRLLAGLGWSGTGVEEDADLQEIDFGLWEGLTFAEIAARFPDQVAEWAANTEGFAFPDGEKLAHFHSRVARVAARIAARPEENVVLITHGGVIRTLLCELLGLPKEHYLLFAVKPARLTMVELHDQGGILKGMNM